MAYVDPCGNCGTTASIAAVYNKHTNVVTQRADMSQPSSEDDKETDNSEKEINETLDRLINDRQILNYNHV